MRRGRRTATAAAGLALAATCGCAAGPGTGPAAPRHAATGTTVAAHPSPVTVPAGPSDRTTAVPPVSAPAVAAPTSAGTPGAPTYRATVSPVTAELVPASWRPGCPVPLEDLRHLRVTHHDMAGGVVEGDLVVHADVADGVVEVFRTLFDAGFPVASMRLVDDFGGDDDASMAADNASAFNCRAVTGGGGWSEHAYGRALDLNPVENPYVSGDVVLPPAGAAFVARPTAPGVVHDGDVAVRAFAAHGWRWGGHWTRPRDYQHFSTTGR